MSVVHGLLSVTSVERGSQWSDEEGGVWLNMNRGFIVVASKQNLAFYSG
jgi:hypothetical protein